MFNKETEYALRGLVYIKLQNIRNRRPGMEEIAKEIGAPRFFTAKILQKLVRAGFVESIKGKGGGFHFNPEKPDLKLQVLISATEGGRSISGCGFGLKYCDENDPCPIHNKYAPIRDKIEKLLSEESVQSLAKKVHRKEGKIKKQRNEN
jgi:Rrf2 family protein